MLFDGAVSNASAPLDSSRPDCHDRGRSRRTSVSAFGQSGQSSFASVAAGRRRAEPQRSRQTESVRRLSIDEAVKLALEQNLGIRIQRFDPQIQDIGVAQARSFWAPQSDHELHAELADAAADQRARRAARPASLNGELLDQRRRRTRRCRGAAPTRATWNSSRFTTTNLFQQLQPAAQLEPEPAVHAAAAAQLRDRSDPPAGRQQQEGRASCPTSSSRRSSRRRCATCRTPTGICRTRSTTSRRSSSRWRCRSSR